MEPAETGTFLQNEKYKVIKLNIFWAASLLLGAEKNRLFIL